MTIELKVDMYLYMKHEGNQSKEDLESKLYKLLDELAENEGIEFCINETELQEV
jgi:hypothetical protein